MTDVPTAETPSPAAGRRQRTRLDRALVFGRRAILVSVVLVIGAMFYAYFTRTKAPDLSKDLRQAALELPANMEHGDSLGNPNAPLKLETFSDFQCPFCLKYAATQEPTLINEYVKTGKLQITHHTLVRLGPESTQAALAAECTADQDKFWAYYQRLYLVEADAGQWGNEKSNVGRFNGSNLRQYAGEVGVDLAAYDKCIKADQHEDTLASDHQEAVNYGINGTPGFALNGVSKGAGAPATLDDWRHMLDGALAAASK